MRNRDKDEDGFLDEDEMPVEEADEEEQPKEKKVMPKGKEIQMQPIVVEREITLSLINEKLNVLLSLLQK